MRGVLSIKNSLMLHDAAHEFAKGVTTSYNGFEAGVNWLIDYMRDSELDTEQRLKEYREDWELFGAWYCGVAPEKIREAFNRYITSRFVPQDESEYKEAPVLWNMEDLIEVKNDWKKCANEILKERDELLEVLKFLIAVKDHKDTKGKDEWYEENQPLAWNKARRAIPQLQNNEPPK